MTLATTDDGELVDTVPGELTPLDPSRLQAHSLAMREVAVSTYLEHAKNWLATAVEVTGPEQIAAAKAEIATAAEATKQLHLSKEIQLDAQEMVRRAEYALGKAIRKGQEEGTIRKRGETGVAWDRWNGLQRETTSSTKASATDFAPAHELRSNDAGIMHLAEADSEEFDVALGAAKAEGNVSRANVVRKIKGQNESASLTRRQRADLIADLASQGMSSRQMPARVGVTEETVRQIARDFDIEIPADKVVGRTRRLDHTQMVEQTVTDLVNATEFIESFIDLAEVDFAEADEWVSSLTNSIRVLNRFVKQIKEKTHV